MSFRGSARNLELAHSTSSSPSLPSESLPIEDRWILSRFQRTVEDVTRALNGFRLGDAQEYVHDFIWNEFCDWYIEIAKIRLRDLSDSPSPAPVLAQVLDGALRLLHPFMPFITEEIWQTLVQRMPASGDRTGSIMVAPYPTPDPAAIDSEAEEWAGLLMALVRGVRNVRAERKVESNKKVPAVLLDGETLGPGGRSFLETLAQCSVEARAGDTPQPENSIMVVEKATRVFLPLAGLFDFAGERHRLQSSLEELRKRIGQIESRLENEQFLSKAPADVVEKERTRLSGWREEEANFLHRLSELG